MGKAATTSDDWRRRAGSGLGALRRFSAGPHRFDDHGWIEAAGRAALALVEGGDVDDAVPLAATVAMADARALPTAAAAWGVIALAAVGDVDGATRAMAEVRSRAGAAGVAPDGDGHGDEGPREVADTVALAFAALHAGDVALAAILSSWCRPFAWEQPDALPGLALAVARDGELVEGRHRARAYAGPQDFWVPAFAAGVLSRVFEECGDDDDLAAAVELHDLTVALGDDVWTDARSAPLAWAAAALFRITGEEPFVATVERVCDLLCETQRPDGSWGAPADDAWAVLSLLESADALEGRRAVEVALAEQVKAAEQAKATEQAP